MSLHQEKQFQALLARFEDDFGDTLRQRREHAAAGKAFMRRFGQASQEFVWPLFSQLDDHLRAHGLATRLQGSYSYDAEASAMAEQVVLAISLDKAIPREPSGPVAGLCLSADSDSRQARLAVRSLTHPDVERITELPLPEQWTADLVEEEILAALEQVLFS
ncbi:MAG TPA: hypothetical protein VFA18_24965 [Gemmataceae bacterium]|nr:hypothetical protein [Gemmataceae bacterium]